MRFPLVDWPRICRGTKRQFRLPTHDRWGARNLECPTPVVGYAMERYQREADYRLFVLSEIRTEPLGVISEEDLAAEGFGSLREFKLYWRRRYQSRGFRMLDPVNVLTVRPWSEADAAEMGDMLLRRLYGPFLK